MTRAERPPWAAALKGDPVDWLLERDNPPVHYLTLTEILDRPPDDPEVVAAREAVWEWPPVRALLDALEERPLDLDNLYRFGVPGGHPAIVRACDHWLEAEEEPRPGCYAEQTIGGLVRYADPSDSRLRAKIRFLVRNQPFADGNRPGTGLRYGTRDVCCGAHSCFSAVARSLWAAAGIPAELRTGEVRRFIERGARFLAAHRVYRRNHHSFKPVKREWLRLHLPFALGWRTDVVDLLDAASQIGLADDPSIADALQFLMSKQNERGRWAIEETFERQYADRLGTRVKDVERVGEESKWITCTALRLLKRCGKLAAALARGDEFQGPAEPPEQPVFSRHRLAHSPEDERRVRAEWEQLGFTPVLDGLLGFARGNGLGVGWRWGLVLGPEGCPEWCAAGVRRIPSRTHKNAWRVARVCFMAKKGQFAAESVSRRLGIPLRYRWPAERKRAPWIDATLWRVAVGRWKGDYEEVGVAVADPKEFPPLRELMGEALAALRRS